MGVKAQDGMKAQDGVKTKPDELLRPYYERRDELGDCLMCLRVVMPVVLRQDVERVAPKPSWYS